jgi:hypothetical protein
MAQVTRFIAPTRNALALLVVAVGIGQVVMLWHTALGYESLLRAVLGFTNILMALGLLGTSRLPLLGTTIMLSCSVMFDADWFRSGTTDSTLVFGLLCVGMLGGLALAILTARAQAPESKA